MLDTVTLVAMAPSGSTLILRDRRGRLWLYPPAGSGRPRVIDPELAERAIGRHDLDRVDRDFASWAELDEYRQERARGASPRIAIDPETFDLEDVERMLAVAERWLGDDQSEQARDLVLRLLRVPAVLSDPATHGRLVDFLERLHEPPLVVRDESRTEFQLAASAQYELPRAA